MLYERWRQIAATNPGALALTEIATGRRWTFAELLKEGESGPDRTGKIVFPQGTSAEFVLAVLRGWRKGQVVWPLEAGQSAPTDPGPLPPGIAHLKTTSATAGTPRLVAFTAAQLAADADNIVATMGLRADWPNLGLISLAHSYGFSNLVLPLLLHGVPLVLVGAALPHALEQAAASGLNFTLAAVPALWRTWHDAHAIPTNVRLAISAGAPLPVELEQAIFASSGLKIHNFYGSSECGGIAYDSAQTPRDDGACAGRPMQGVEVTVAEDGCLKVRSQAVGQTYWPEPDSRLTQGVFHTRDLGEIVGGCVYLRGRATDQINVAGRKVVPETIEKVLATHPQVRECLAFGIPCPDARRGEIIVACVAAPEGISSRALRDYALARLPDWQVPREWWVLDSLEANQRGKISRAEWRKRYLQQRKINGNH